MLKKIILSIFALALLLVIGGYFFINSAPALPANAEAGIQAALSEELPEFVKGKTAYANNDGIKIWYESIVETDSIKGSVLLIMGHSTDGLVWGRYFFQPLLDAGYQVIRYDNRGTGLSDRMENWRAETAYDLSDMALDGLAILDDLGIDQAHVVGVSMGGMIAQTMAIHHPERVKSLNPIMSSGYMFDPELPNAPSELVTLLTKITLKYLLGGDDADACRFAIAVDQGLSGSNGFQSDPKYIAQRTLYNKKYRKGRNLKVGDQHTKAIELSGSRYEQLPNLKVPTLIVHGKADPLIKFVHAEKYAPMIPNSKTLWLDEMGHNIPPAFATVLTSALLDNFESASVLAEK